jgi:hypothetical protein
MECRDHIVKVVCGEMCYYKRRFEIYKTTREEVDIPYEHLDNMPYIVEVRGGCLIENPGLSLDCPETGFDSMEDQCKDDFDYWYECAKATDKLRTWDAYNEHSQWVQVFMGDRCYYEFVGEPIGQIDEWEFNNYISPVVFLPDSLMRWEKNGQGAFFAKPADDEQEFERMYQLAFHK